MIGHKERLGGALSPLIGEFQAGNRKSSHDGEKLVVKAASRPSLHRIKIATPRGLDEAQDPEMPLNQRNDANSSGKGIWFDRIPDTIRGFGKTELLGSRKSPKEGNPVAKWTEVQSFVEERVSNMALNITRTYSDTIIQLKNAVKHLTTQLADSGDENKRLYLKLTLLQDTIHSQKQSTKESLAAYDSQIKQANSLGPMLEKKLFDLQEQLKSLVRDSLQSINTNNNKASAVLGRKVGKLSQKVKRLQLHTQQEIGHMQKELEGVSSRLEEVRPDLAEIEGVKNAISGLKLGFRSLSKESKQTLQRVVDMQVEAKGVSKDYKDMLGNLTIKRSVPTRLDAGVSISKIEEISKNLSSGLLGPKNSRGTTKVTKLSQSSEHRKIKKVNILEEVLATHKYGLDGSLNLEGSNLQKQIEESLKVIQTVQTYWKNMLPKNKNHADSQYALPDASISNVKPRSKSIEGESYDLDCLAQSLTELKSVNYPMKPQSKSPFLHQPKLHHHPQNFRGSPPARIPPDSILQENQPVSQRSHPSSRSPDQNTKSHMHLALTPQTPNAILPSILNPAPQASRLEQPLSAQFIQEHRLPAPVQAQHPHPSTTLTVKPDGGQSKASILPTKQVPDLEPQAHPLPKDPDDRYTIPQDNNEAQNRHTADEDSDSMTFFLDEANCLLDRHGRPVLDDKGARIVL